MTELAKDDQGKYSIYFKDRSDKSEGWIDQADQLIRNPHDIANRLALWLSASMDQYSRCDEMREHIKAWIAHQTIAQSKTD